MTSVDKIDMILSYVGVKAPTFASSIGVNYQRILDIQIGKTKSISSNLASHIVDKYPEIDLNWLLTGEGEMLKGSAPKDEDYLPRITDNPNEGRPYYDVDFLGGYGEQESETGVVPNYNIDYKPFNRDGVFYSNLYGDSMYPEFHSGAVLAMRPVEGWQDFLVLGKIYAIITTGGQRTVKQLAKGADEDSYTLVPINPKYESQPIPKRAILAVYEVLGGINRYE